MKRIPMSEKRFVQIILGAWCFSFGIMFAIFVGVTNTSIDVEHVEYVYNLPINVSSSYENYSNSMVRDAINYSICYVCNESRFENEQYHSWLLWKEYKSRVVDADFNYWIISYSFGI